MPKIFDPLADLFDTSEMDAEEFDEILAAMTDVVGYRVTSRRLASLLGRHEQQLSRMKTGKYDYPPEVRLLLRLIRDRLEQWESQNVAVKAIRDISII